MRLGLRAGELVEDGERDVLRALCKAGCLDDGMDVRERAVSMVVTMLVAVLMLVLVAVTVLVLVTVAVLLVGFFPVLPKEPRHVVVVVLMLVVKLHIEVAGVEAALCHAAHADLEAVDGKGAQRGQEPLLARAQVQERRHGHVAADAGGPVHDEGAAAAVLVAILFIKFAHRWSTPFLLLRWLMRLAW